MDRWQQAWQARNDSFAPSIGFVRPNRTLPISLTGTYCALDCAHCGGHYLSGMTSIDDATAGGATSCLISGGCDTKGAVPVASHIGKLSSLHRGRLFNWHVGMVSGDSMDRIAALVDVVSFDIVGDDATIREVYGIDYTANDYFRAYRSLRRRFIVVPHLTLGLRAGQFSGEHAALTNLSASPPEALVLLVFVPTAGTRFAQCAPPDRGRVADYLLQARLTLPQTQLYLGCMRPGGRYRTELDPLAVRSGVNKIVNPAPSAVQLADDLGLQIRWEYECCAFQRQVLSN
jgi:lipoyl synthase